MTPDQMTKAGLSGRRDGQNSAINTWPDAVTIGQQSSAPILCIDVFQQSDAHLSAMLSVLNKYPRSVPCCCERMRGISACEKPL